MEYTMDYMPPEEDTGHTHRREETPYGYPALEGKTKVRTPAEVGQAKVRSPQLDEGIAASESIAYTNSLYY
jgi:hypothetical protein